MHTTLHCESWKLTQIPPPTQASRALGVNPYFTVEQKERMLRHLRKIELGHGADILALRPGQASSVAADGEEHAPEDESEPEGVVKAEASGSESGSAAVDEADQWDSDDDFEYEEDDAAPPVARK